MGKILKQTGSELKQLPLILAKLLGGIMAVIGLSAAIFLATRSPEPASGDPVLSALLGVSGIAVFILSSKALVKRKADRQFQDLETRDKVRLSFLAWVLLLVFVALFLVIVLFLAR